MTARGLICIDIMDRYQGFLIIGYKEKLFMESGF